jgi:hypothetical protein
MMAKPVDNSLNLFGNIRVKIDVPFVKGLSYTGKFSDNWRHQKNYIFEPFGHNFQGAGHKSSSIIEELNTNNVIHYKRTFNDVHSLYVTLLYNAGKIDQESTTASSSVFPYFSLGYNSLQAGAADQQEASSGGYTESSLAEMGRINYGYNHKYLITGTIRRDGFSGFGKNNKFGIFPSVAVAWVASEEPFIARNLKWLNQLKLRIAYGKNGNRTIGRYQTFPKVKGNYGYVS